MNANENTKAATCRGINQEKVFRNFHRIDWTKFALAIGATIIFWTGMKELMPETLHHQIEVILAATNGAILFLLKGERALQS